MWFVWSRFLINKAKVLDKWMLPNLLFAFGETWTVCTVWEDTCQIPASATQRSWLKMNMRGCVCGWQVVGGHGNQYPTGHTDPQHQSVASVG
jgi:hypothetical protein